MYSCGPKKKLYKKKIVLAACISQKSCSPVSQWLSPSLLQPASHRSLAARVSGSSPTSRAAGARSCRGAPTESTACTRRGTSTAATWWSATTTSQQPATRFARPFLPTHLRRPFWPFVSPADSASPFHRPSLSIIRHPLSIIRHPSSVVQSVVVHPIIHHPSSSLSSIILHPSSIIRRPVCRHPSSVVQSVVVHHPSSIIHHPSSSIICRVSSIAIIRPVRLLSSVVHHSYIQNLSTNGVAQTDYNLNWPSIGPAKPMVLRKFNQFTTNVSSKNLRHLALFKHVADGL